MDNENLNVIETDESNTLISGTPAGDSISATGDFVTIEAVSGADTVNVQGNSNFVDGGDGDNLIVNNGANNTTITTGSGEDSIAIYGGANVSIDGGDGENFIVNNTGSSATLQSGDGNDTVVNLNGENIFIDAGDGENQILSNGYNTTINSGADADYVEINGSGVDLGNVIVNTGAGDDVVDIYESSLGGYYTGYISVNGGEGDDQIYADYQAESTTLLGGSGNDYIFNNNPNAVIDGGDGDDFVWLYSNDNNTIVSSAGDDTIYGYESGTKILADVTSAATDVINRSNVILNTSDGYINLLDADGKTISLLDTAGNVTETIVSSGNVNTGVDVMKKFFDVLKPYAEDTYTDGVEILDQAVKAVSFYGSLEEAVDAFTYAVTDESVYEDTYERLRETCGIILGDDYDYTADTGAVSGYNAGGSEVKNAQDIVPEPPGATLSEQEMPEAGSTVAKSFYGADGTYHTFTITAPKNFTTITNYKTSEEIDVSGNANALALIEAAAKGINAWWFTESVKLAYDSFGLDFDDTDVEYIFYTKDNSFSAITSNNSDDDSSRNFLDTTPYNKIKIGVNLDFFAEMDLDNQNGDAVTNVTDPDNRQDYLDRIIAHEFIHAVMFKAGLMKRNMPQFFTEGVADLIQGNDDYVSTYSNVLYDLAEDYGRLSKALEFKAGTGTSDAYPSGYAFLRYLIHQNLNTQIALGTDEADVFNYYGGNAVVSGYGVGDTVYYNAGLTGVQLLGSDYLISSGSGDLLLRDFNDKTLAVGNLAAIDGETFTVNNVSGSMRVGREFLTFNDATATFDLATGNISNISGTISGFGGGDYLVNGGNFTMSAGDYIVGGSSGTTIFADDPVTSGSSIIGGSNVTIDGYGGEEIITESVVGSSVSGSDAILYTSSGNIVIAGGVGENISLNGGSTILGGIDGNYTQSDTGVAGTDFDDTLRGTYNESAIFNGRGGNDFISVTEGTTLGIYGGDGDDTIEVSHDENFDPSLSSYYSHYTTIDGDAGNDLISIGEYYHGATVIFSAGNDTLEGYTDTKILLSEIPVIGQSGNNVVINGANGTLTVMNANKNYLNLAYKLFNTVEGAEISTGDEDDFIDNRGAYSTLNLGGGNNEIENVAANTEIITGDGNDSISSHADNVTIDAGYGNNVFDVNGDSNFLVDGYGHSEIILRKFATNTTVEAGYGNDTIFGYESDTQIVAQVSSMRKIGDNVILTTDHGSITIEDGKDKTLNINGEGYTVGNLNNGVDVMTKFFNTMYVYADENYVDGVEVLNKAVRAVSFFDSLEEAVDAFTYAITDASEYEDTYERLREICGIVLGDDEDYSVDTGAAIGYNAGGSEILNAQDIVPEPEGATLSEQEMPAAGETVAKSFYGKDGTYHTFTITAPENFTTILDAQNNDAALDISDDADKHAMLEAIAKGLNAWWFEEAAKLAYDSYGLDIDGANITYGFSNSKDYSGLTGPNSENDSSRSDLDTTPYNEIKMLVSLDAFEGMDLDNQNGDNITATGKGEDYVDRVIAHEMIHAVMFKHGMLKRNMPQFFTEGVADLVQGNDDFVGRYTKAISEYTEDYRRIYRALEFKAGTGTDDAYSGGYTFLRYLINQSLNTDIFFGTDEEDVYNYYGGNAVVSGFEDFDSVTFNSNIFGVELSNGDYLISGETGSLLLRDTGDKFISVYNADDNLFLEMYGENVSVYDLSGTTRIGKEYLSFEEVTATFDMNTGAISNFSGVLSGFAGGTYTINGETVSLSAADSVSGNGYDSIEITGGEVETDGDSITSGYNVTIDGYGGEEISATVDEATISGSDVIFYTDGGNITIVDGAGATLNLNGDETVIGGISAEETLHYQGIAGTDYADTLTVNDKESPLLNGRGGDDLIIASGGEKAQLYGGDDNDTISVSGGELATIDAGAGNDFITLSDVEGATVIFSDGNDTLSGAAEIMTTENLSVEETGGNVIISGENGTLTVTDATADDITIVHNIFNTLDGAEFNFGDGNDTIMNVGSGTEINLGGGNDTVFSNADSVTVSASGGDNLIAMKGDSNEVYTGAGDDSIEVNGGSNTIYIGGGDDFISEYSSDTNIVAQVVSSRVKGNDVIITTDEGTITIEDGKNKEIIVNGEKLEVGHLNTGVDIMKNFFDVLKYYGNDTETNGVEILGEAVKAVSVYRDLADAIDNFIYDVTQTDGDYLERLQNAANVILNGEDTGAASGKNAGGSEILNAEDIVPESVTSLAEIALPEAGSVSEYTVTGNDGTEITFSVKWQDSFSAVRDFTNGNAMTELTDQTFGSDDDTITAAEILEYIPTLAKGMTLWLPAAVKLAYDSYGVSFDGKTIDAYFDVNAPYIAATNPPDNVYHDTPVDSIEIAFNAGSFAVSPLDVDDPNGNYGGDMYIDRVLAHEMIHAVMFGSGTFKNTMPEFFTEGVADLVHGADDSRTFELQILASNYNTLFDNMSFIPGTGGAFTYAAGDLFLRYLINQNLNTEIIFGTDEADVYEYYGGDAVINNFDASDSISVNENIISSVELSNGDVLITSDSGKLMIRGGAAAITDSKGEEITPEAESIDGGEGEEISNSDIAARIVGTTSGDTITSTGMVAFIDGRAGDDSISSSGSYAKIHGGAGNDTIISTGDDVLVEGGEGDDYISISGENATVETSAGNDTLTGADSDTLIIVNNPVDVGENLIVTENGTLNVEGSGYSVAYRIISAANDTLISGSAGDDTIMAFGENVSVDAGGGNDVITALDSFNSEITLVNLYDSITGVEFEFTDEGLNLKNGDDVINLAYYSKGALNIDGHSVYAVKAGNSVEFDSAVDYYNVAENSTLTGATGEIFVNDGTISTSGALNISGSDKIYGLSAGDTVAIDVGGDAASFAVNDDGTALTCDGATVWSGTPEDLAELNLRDYYDGNSWDSDTLAALVADIFQRTNYGTGAPALAQLIFPHSDTVEPTKPASSETLTTTSADGLTLSGTHYAPKISNGNWVILVTGYGQGKESMSPFIDPYIEKGYEVLTIDPRATGDSEGEWLTMGVAESADLALWTQKVAEIDGDAGIILHGVSMGAATAMMAAARTDTTNVTAVVEDCGYTDIKATIQKIVENNNLEAIFSNTAVYDAFYEMAEQLTGYDISSAVPLDVIGEVTVPSLFINGDEDNIVPAEMAQELFDASGAEKKEILIVEGAGHAQSGVVDYDTYDATVFELIGGNYAAGFIPEGESLTIDGVTYTAIDGAAKLNIVDEKVTGIEGGKVTAEIAGAETTPVITFDATDSEFEFTATADEILNVKYSGVSIGYVSGAVTYSASGMEIPAGEVTVSGAIQGDLSYTLALTAAEDTTVSFENEMVNLAEGESLSAVASILGTEFAALEITGGISFNAENNVVAFAEGATLNASIPILGDMEVAVTALDNLSGNFGFNASTFGISYTPDVAGAMDVNISHYGKQTLSGEMALKEGTVSLGLAGNSIGLESGSVLEFTRGDITFTLTAIGEDATTVDLDGEKITLNSGVRVEATKNGENLFNGAFDLTDGKIIYDESTGEITVYQGSGGTFTLSEELKNKIDLSVIDGSINGVLNLGDTVITYTPSESEGAIELSITRVDSGDALLAGTLKMAGGSISYDTAVENPEVAKIALAEGVELELTDLTLFGSENKFAATFSAPNGLETTLSVNDGVPALSFTGDWEERPGIGTGGDIPSADDNAKLAFTVTPAGSEQAISGSLDVLTGTFSVGADGSISFDSGTRLVVSLDNLAYDIGIVTNENAATTKVTVDGTKFIFTPESGDGDIAILLVNEEQGQAIIPTRTISINGAFALDIVASEVTLYDGTTINLLPLSENSLGFSVTANGDATSAIAVNADGTITVTPGDTALDVAIFSGDTEIFANKLSLSGGSIVVDSVNQTLSLSEGTTIAATTDDYEILATVTDDAGISAAFTENGVELTPEGGKINIVVNNGDTEIFSGELEISGGSVALDAANNALSLSSGLTASLAFGDFKITTTIPEDMAIPYFLSTNNSNLIYFGSYDEAISFDFTTESGGLTIPMSVTLVGAISVSIAGNSIGLYRGSTATLNLGNYSISLHADPLSAVYFISLEDGNFLLTPYQNSSGTSYDAVSVEIASSDGATIFSGDLRVSGGSLLFNPANQTIGLKAGTTVGLTQGDYTISATALDDANVSIAFSENGIALTPIEGDGALNISIAQGDETIFSNDISISGGSIVIDNANQTIGLTAGTTVEISLNGYEITATATDDASVAFALTESGLEIIPAAGDGSLDITLSGAGGSLSANVEVLSGSFILGQGGAITATKDTELQIDFGDGYVVNFKATDDAGGTIILGDGITFAPNSDDGGLELSVTQNGDTRTTNLNVTGSVTYKLGGELSLAEGTVIENTWEDGAALKMTATADEIATVRFDPDTGLIVTDEDNSLELELTLLNGGVINIDSITGTLIYKNATASLLEGGSLRLEDSVNEQTVSVESGTATIDFSEMDDDPEVSMLAYNISDSGRVIVKTLNVDKALILVNGQFKAGANIQLLVPGSDIYGAAGDSGVGATTFSLDGNGDYTINGIDVTVSNIDLHDKEHYGTAIRLIDNHAILFTPGTATISYDGTDFTGDRAVFIDDTGGIIVESEEITNTESGVAISLLEGDTLNNSGDSVTVDGAGTNSIDNSGTGGVINIDGGDNFVENNLGDGSSIITGDGDDTIENKDADNVYINAGAGNNFVSSACDNVTVISEGGNDTIIADGASTSITAGDGDNFIGSTNGDNVTITSGTGNDTITNTNANAAYIDAGDGDNFIVSYLGYSVDSVAQTLNNQYESETVITGTGNDTIVNYGGYYVSIDSGEGNDSIRVHHSYYNTIEAGEGDDKIILQNGHYQNVYAGEGDDTIIGSIISGSGNWATGGYAQLFGEDGNDYINPIYANDSFIDGGDGNDTIITDGANSTIDGGDGDDYIEIGASATSNVIATFGNDTISGYNDTTTIQAGEILSTELSGKDVILTTDEGIITVVNGAGKVLNVEVEGELQKVAAGTFKVAEGETLEANEMTFTGAGKVTFGGEAVTITNGINATGVEETETPIVLTKRGTVTLDGQTFQLTEKVPVGITVAPIEDGISAAHVITANDVAENETEYIGRIFKEEAYVYGDDEYFVRLDAGGIRSIYGISDKTTVEGKGYTETAIGSGEYEDDYSVLILGLSEAGVYTFGDESYTIGALTSDTPVGVNARFNENGTINISRVRYLNGNTISGNFEAPASIGGEKVAQVVSIAGDDSFEITGSTKKASAISGVSDGATIISAGGAASVTTDEEGEFIFGAQKFTVEGDTSATFILGKNNSVAGVDGLENGTLIFDTNTSALAINGGEKITLGTDSDTSIITADGAISSVNGVSLVKNLTGDVTVHGTGAMTVNKTAIEIAGDDDFDVIISDGEISSVVGISDGATVDGKNISFVTEEEGNFVFGFTEEDSLGATLDAQAPVTFSLDRGGLIDSVSGLDGTIYFNYGASAPVNFNGTTGEVSSAFSVTGDGEKLVSLSGFENNSTIFADNDSVLIPLEKDGTITVNYKKFGLSGDSDGVTLAGNNITGLDAGAKITVDTAGTYNVNGTALKAEADDIFIGTEDGAAYILDKVHAPITDQTTNAEMREYFNAPKTYKRVETDTDLTETLIASGELEGNMDLTLGGIDADFSETSGRKVITLTDGDQNIKFNDKGNNAVIIGDGVTGNKTIELGDGGDFVIIGDTNAAINIVAGSGNDTIVSRGENVSIDSANGGAAKIVPLAGNISVDNYHASVGAGIQTNYKNISKAIEDSKIEFGNGEVSIGGAKIYFDDGYENSTLVDFYNVQGREQLVGFTDIEGGVLDVSAVKKPVIMVGDRHGISTLIGGLNSDTIYASGGDFIDAGDGDNQISLKAAADRKYADEGVTIAMSTAKGATTVTGFNATFDQGGDFVDVATENIKLEFDGANLEIKNGRHWLTLKDVGENSSSADAADAIGDVSFARVMIGNEDSAIKTAVAEKGAVIEYEDNTAQAYIGEKSGVDFSKYDHSIYVNLRDSVGTLGGEDLAFIGIDNVRASSAKATLIGSEGSNILYAGAGDDSIWGVSGYDTYYGYTGEDKMGATEFFFDADAVTIEDFKFMDGDLDFRADKINTINRAINDVRIVEEDVVVGIDGGGALTLKKAVGQDFQINDVVAQVSTGDLTFDGRADYFRSSGANAAVSVDSALDNAEVWLSNAKAEKFYGDIKALDASGIAGQSTLVGNEIDNVITAGAGNSSLWGGASASNDTLIGGGGSDLFWYESGNGNDVIQGAGENDTVNLFGITLDMLASTEVSDGIKIQMKDGGSVELDTNDGTTFTLGDGSSYVYDKSAGDWKAK